MRKFIRQEARLVNKATGLADFKSYIVIIWLTGLQKCQFDMKPLPCSRQYLFYHEPRGHV